MDPIVENTKAHMQRAIDVMVDDFATVRTGKANPALVENIVIQAYGGSTPLKVLELATIHAQDPQTIVITPFDQSVISEIETGIKNSNLGFSPVVDGQIIRISIPPLTEERRLEFVKAIHQKAENGKIMIRQVRHESMEAIEKKKEEVSEDEIEREKKDVQRLTDEFIKKIDDLKSEKEKELMTI
jgi:ribosome recycling factor